MFRLLNETNSVLFHQIHSLSLTSLRLDVLLIIVADNLDWALILIFPLALFLLKGIKEGVLLSLVALISSFVSWTVAELIKETISLARPFETVSAVTLLSHADIFGSFPSGHATFFAGLAAILFMLNRKTAFVYSAFAIFVGFGRIATGLHWPLDILYGWLLGATLSPLIFYVTRRLANFCRN